MPALVVTAVAISAPAVGDRHVVDSDGDGLPNDVEISGWRTELLRGFVTDPHNPDTDGDGLTDGEEAGALDAAPGAGPMYIGISNPLRSDTDSDGIGDFEEQVNDLNPRRADTDEDGLDDNVEREFGSDPTLANTDGDSYSDAQEYDRGSDPLTYTLTTSESREALEAGAKWGDCVECARGDGLRDEQIDSVAYLAGHIASGLAVYGDVRDVGVAIKHLDVISAGVSIVGLVPTYGDSLRTTAILTKFAKRGDAAASVVRAFIERLHLSKAATKKMLDKVLGSARIRPKMLSVGPKVCSVYVARSLAGAIRYVGITNDVRVRQAQHGDRFAITPIDKANGLRRGECRAIEEAVIVRGGFQSAGGALENKIHSISPKSEDYDQVVDFGTDWLTRNAPDLMSALPAA